MGKKNVSSSMTVQDLMRLFTGILNGFRNMQSVVQQRCHNSI